MINWEPWLHRRSLLKAILSWPLAWMGGFGLTKAAPFIAINGGCRRHKTEKVNDPNWLNWEANGERIYEVRIYDPGDDPNE